MFILQNASCTRYVCPCLGSALTTLLCTSGFVDDVMMSHNNCANADTGRDELLNVTRQLALRGEVFSRQLHCFVLCIL